MDGSIGGKISMTRRIPAANQIFYSKINYCLIHFSTVPQWSSYKILHSEIPPLRVTRYIYGVESVIFVREARNYSEVHYIWMSWLMHEAIYLQK